MLLGRFIKELFDNQVTLITTSNTHPDNLYKDGLHRSRFLPAIESIKDNCKVYELDSAQDYRLRTLEQLEIFIICKEGKELENAPERFFTRIRSVLSKTFGHAFQERIIKFIHSSWGLNDFTLGSYSYALPGTTNDRELLKKSLNKKSRILQS